MEMTTYEMMAAARERTNAFVKSKRAELDALGPRRKRAEAKVATLEKKRAEVGKANDDCDDLDEALANLQQRRTKELGLAHIEDRRPALGVIDREITKKTEQRAATVERIEATRAATEIVEEQLADARAFLASEVKAINEMMSEGRRAISAAESEYEAVVLRYAATISAAAQASLIVARHFEPYRDARYEWYLPSYYVWADSGEWTYAVKQRYAEEVARLAVIGLPKSDEAVRRSGYYEGVQMPTRDVQRRAGTYDARGNCIG
jgi:hypothetical protein